MKVFVINLDEQAERMDFQTKQLNALELSFERVPAVQIKDKTDPRYTQYAKSWRQLMSTSEVSCFLSHYQIWKKIDEGQSPALILEDDAWLSVDINETLMQIQELEKADYINLEVTGSNRKRLVAKKPSQQLEHVNIFRLYQGRSGAGGYILWPAGARKLLNKEKSGRIELTDKFINSCYSLKAYLAEPAQIIQLDQCEQHGLEPPIVASTTIRRQSLIGVNRIERLKLRSKRAIIEVRTGLNILINFKKTHRRRIQLSSRFRNKEL